MARKRKQDIGSPVSDNTGGVNSELDSTFRASDYANATDRIDFVSVTDMFDFSLKFSEPKREFRKVSINGEPKVVIPLGKLGDTKYVLLTKKGDKIVAKIDNIKMI